MKKKLILLLVVMLGFIGQGFLAVENNLFPSVTVDPRVELFSLIFRLAGNPEYNRCRIPSYNTDIEDYFIKFKEHSAVKIARRLRESRGVSFDAVMSLAVHLTNPPQLKAKVPLKPHPLFLDKRWPPEDTLKFLNAARSFAVDSKFNTFYSQHQPLYDAAVSRLKTYLQKNGRFNWFNTFFGTGPRATFTVIMGMLNGSSSYGVKVSLPSGGEELFSILGIWTVDRKGNPIFDASVTGFDVIPTIIHEFCHSFINPLVNKYEKQLEKAGRTIFSYVVSDMKKQAYNSWKILVSESLVRASVIRYILKGSGPTAARKQMAKDVKRKFIWIEDLSNRLGEYESQRDKYKDFEAFLPRIITFFNRYAAKNKSRLAQLQAEKKNPWEMIKGSTPKIVSMTPANGAVDVDPNLQAITIVFNCPMQDHSWSIMRLNKNFPQLTGDPKYDEQRKALTVPVKLEPDRLYELGLNAEDYLGFRSEKGVPLKPVQVSFTTRKSR